MPDFTTTLTASVVKSATGPATNALTRWGKRKYDSFIATYTNFLKEYIEQSVNQCYTVNNILYKGQTAKTLEKYVNVSFQRSEETYEDVSLLSALTSQRRILIRGSGGAGKTMFTKWTVLQMAETILNHQKIPIYIELRDLPLDKIDQPLEELIFRRISSNRQKTNFNQFLEGIKAGIFVLVLDAADEVKKDRRGVVLKKINQFAITFPETSVLLTSRDFQQVDGISGFEEYRTIALSQSQAIEILQKLDYKKKVKDALIADIELGKFKKHSFFLENPLLVTILLLTFDQSREIPTKRSSFYKRAFDALYERHDSSKDVDFSRDHHAGLPIDDFERVFSHFCFATYVNSNYDFTGDNLNRMFRISAQEILGDSDLAEKIARDSVESACLLVREGHDYVFVHRSFQEYFTAIYIKNYKENDIGELISLALLHGHGENTLEFIYELDQVSLEREFILPRLTKINRKTAKYDLENVDDCIQFLANFFKNIRLTCNDLLFSGLQFPENGDSIFLFNISMLFPEADIFRILSSSGLRSDAFTHFPKEQILASASGSIVKHNNKPHSIKISFSPTPVNGLLPPISPSELRNSGRV